MNISNSELNLLELIWENEPLKSGELVAIAFEKLGWKKSTVYTVIKKLSNKGIICSEEAIIHSLYGKDEVFAERSDNLIQRAYGGSLSMFLTAFLGKEKLSQQEAEELKQLIDAHTEEE